MTIGTIDRKKILSLYSPSGDQKLFLYRFSYTFVNAIFLGVYDLRKIYAKRHEMPDPCCDDDLADVT
jgi:hypothetical protein